jgi:hypothetical protein
VEIDVATFAYETAERHDLAIPLDLEASYEQTCRDLRMG